MLLVLNLFGTLVAQDPKIPARILAFEGIPRSVKVGESVELRWVARGTDKVRLDPSGEELPAQGRMTRVLGKSTLFWLHAINAKGGESVPLVIEVRPSRVASQRPLEASNGNWIQFAALADESRAQQLGKTLEQLSGHPVSLSTVEAPKRPGQRLHRIRMGPFATRDEARRRLKDIASRILPLRLKPWLAED